MKKPQAKKTLSDLKPGQTIQCFMCLETKPEAGSVPFRAHKVCSICAARVQAKEEKK